MQAIHTIHRNSKSITAKGSILTVLFLAALLSFSTTCLASTITLQWDPPAAPGLAGYKLYYSTNPDGAFAGTGASQGASPVDVSNQNSATLTGLDPAQAYYFAVTAYDSTGGESPFSEIVQVQELLPPAVSITAPSANASVSGTVSVSAHASDNVAVTRIETYVNGVLQSTDSATPYLYSWDTSSLAAGVYTLVTKAYDAAGNVGESARVAVTVVNDTTAPNVLLAAPGNGATVKGVVPITATATDDIGVTKVELYANGTLLFAGNVAPYSYQWDTTALTDGSYTLSAKAYDAVGNVGYSAIHSVTVQNQDRIAPLVAISAPGANGTASGSVAVSASASDNVAVTQVAFFVNGFPQAISNSAPYRFTWNTTALANGTYNLSARAYDAAGNVGQSATVAVKVFNDKSAPAVSISSPVANSTVGGTAAVSASASDNVAVTKVAFFVNGFPQAISNSAPYRFTWNTTALANGTYNLSARAYDAAGNVGQSATVAVKVFNDKSAPAVSISSPVANSTVGGTAAVSASASDNVAVTKVAFYLNGVLQATSTSAPYGFTWNTSALANGSYNLSARAYDAAGNVGQSTTVAVKVFNDKTAPTVVITSPLSNSATDGTVAVSASASDNVAVKKVEFYLNGVLQATSTAAPYSFNWNTAALADGPYTLSAKAYDAAGNVGQSAGLTVTVAHPDLTPPSIAFVAPTTAYVAGSSIRIAASATDNVAVTRMELYIDGVLKSTVNASSFNNYWPLAVGQHVITVKAYDKSNVGSSSMTVKRVF